MTDLVANADEQWELYYWKNIKEDGQNHMIGRGEFVRLMFEAAGVPYVEPDSQATFEFVRNGGNKGFPCLAPPVIKKGTFVLGQTPAIMRYLGREFGLYPKTIEEEAHADSIIATVTDFVAEGRLVFHSRCFTESYYTQKDEQNVKNTIKWFQEKRLPQFLTYFEKVLQFNTSAESADYYFVGNGLTFADIGVFHSLEAAASQFKDEYKQLVDSGAIPFLEKFRAHMKALPNIASYLASPRRGFFEGNSMM